MNRKDVWVVASFVCKEGKEQELLKHLLVLVDEVNREPGCIKYDCYQDTENPLSFTFIEHWESQEHLDAHAAGAAVERWREVSGHLREPGTEVRVLRDVDF